MSDAMDEATLIERVRALSAPLTPQPTGAVERVPHLAGVRAVLFDVYGTMLISASGEVGTARAHDSATALRQALAEAGVDCEPAQAAPRGVGLLEARIADDHRARRAEGIEHPEVEIRDVWDRVLRGLREEGLIGGAWDRATVERLAVEYECRVNPVWPMPQLSETLDRLRSAGLTLGIISNAQFFTPLLCPALLGASHTELGFRDELCVWSYQMREAKPSVRLYEHALEPLRRTWGIEPGEVLYIGNDVRNDVGPAQRAGCRAALFAGDQRSLRWRADDPGCAGVRPEAVITRLDHVPVMLGRGTG